jgi:hypothetical protein
MPTRLSRCFSMTLTQPSAICARQMSAAWRLRQSASAMHLGSSADASGMMVVPPSASASRSRHSCPNSYSSPSPSASYLSDVPRCHSGTSWRAQRGRARQLQPPPPLSTGEGVADDASTKAPMLWTSFPREPASCFDSSGRHLTYRQSGTTPDSGGGIPLAKLLGARGRRCTVLWGDRPIERPAKLRRKGVGD